MVYIKCKEGDLAQWKHPVNTSSEYELVFLTHQLYPAGFSAKARDSLPCSPVLSGAWLMPSVNPFFPRATEILISIPNSEGTRESWESWNSVDFQPRTF